MVPQLPPQISGLPNRFSPGDWLHLNCTSGESIPAARIIWFVNGHEVLNQIIPGTMLSEALQLKRKSICIGNSCIIDFVPRDVVQLCYNLYFELITLFSRPRTTWSVGSPPWLTASASEPPTTGCSSGSRTTTSRPTGSYPSGAEPSSETSMTARRTRSWSGSTGCRTKSCRLRRGQVWNHNTQIAIKTATETMELQNPFNAFRNESPKFAEKKQLLGYYFWIAMPPFKTRTFKTRKIGKYIEQPLAVSSNDFRLVQMVNME